MAVTARSPDNLEWKVTRPLVPEWMRPGLPKQYSAGPYGGRIAAGPVLIVAVVFSILLLPLVPLVVMLRRFGLVSTTLRAVTRPWGRRGPATVLVYAVRGHPEDVERAQAELVEKLQRGDGAPELSGAERIR